MTRPSAQHDWMDNRLPKSGVHDPDCKWLCDYQPTPPLYEDICRRLDHAPCRVCGSGLTDDEIERWDQDLAYITADVKEFMTFEQHTWLIKHGLSVVDVLTGQLPASLMDEADDVLFRPWNAFLGRRYFGWSVSYG